MRMNEFLCVAVPVALACGGAAVVAWPTTAGLTPRAVIDCGTLDGAGAIVLGFGDRVFRVAIQCQAEDAPKKGTHL